MARNHAVSLAVMPLAYGHQPRARLVLLHGALVKAITNQPTSRSVISSPARFFAMISTTFNSRPPRVVYKVTLDVLVRISRRTRCRRREPTLRAEHVTARSVLAVEAIWWLQDLSSRRTQTRAQQNEAIVS